MISIKLGLCLAAGLAAVARAAFASAARNGDREPRVYVYARASTKKQVDSPETQRENATKYADMLGLGEVTSFVGAARSGKLPRQERDAGVFRCQRGVLTAITKTLDEIVSQGLRAREIVIPRRTAE